MVKKIAVSLMCAVLLVSGQVFAQGTESDEIVKPMGPKKQLAIIVFAGLSGAILGLSTLSFYGRPQEKLSNIAIGFAVGIIAGTSYTTYKAATQPRSFYEGAAVEEMPEVDSPEIWQSEILAQQAALEPLSAPGLGLKWEF